MQFLFYEILHTFVAITGSMVSYDNSMPCFPYDSLSDVKILLDTYNALSHYLSPRKLTLGPYSVVEKDQNCLQNHYSGFAGCCQFLTM